MTSPPSLPLRRAGLLVPLFSVPSSRSWGIGEIPDLGPLAAWLSRAGQRLLQILPITEMPAGETSPYSSLSAMAIDPQFIALADLEDVVALGGEGALAPDQRHVLDTVRASPTIDYRRVRSLKDAVLRRACAGFRRMDTRSERHAAFRAYVEAQAWWLDDYALFRALHEHYGERPWTEWPEAVRTREPGALEAARHEVADGIFFRQYLQWVADAQWADVRRRIAGVSLFGDLPFMVGGDSADVWARQHQFQLDVSVGVPPDAFSETGQDWRLPACRWDVMAEDDFGWLRDRARRNADLYDGFRVDHVVGFYRTYCCPTGGGEGRFTPADPEAQLQLGERVLGVFRGAGAEVTAEDLGTVPDFVRASLARLGLPGYKVFRWEREWTREGQPFVDPADYPPTAVATTGTHDTEPNETWWAEAPLEDRLAVLAIPSLRDRLSEEERLRAAEAPELLEPARDALLEALNASGANILILPIQDAFGWPDRINQPATVNDQNWTWRLPWPSDEMTLWPEAEVVARRLRTWATRHGRR